MKLPNFAKFALKLVIGAGVNEVLNNMIKFTTPEELTKPRQIMVKIGTYALTSMIAGVIADQTVKEIDEMLREITAPLDGSEKEPTPMEHPVKVGMTTEDAIESMKRASDLLHMEVPNGGKVS